MSKDLVQLEVGTAVGGFEVTRREPLDHLNGTYYELFHAKTGARHIHIAVPDENKGFGIVFPTVPKDSAGVAHILEHLVLTGSEKFPVSDPFFAMLARSLQTFMNASTSDDATVYLFSTRNVNDLYNLASVYLDASFFPALREESFKQEGHRFEFETPDDPSTPLQIRGVVFNEMKGYMASAYWTMRYGVGASVYPDLTYAYNAGGDPEEIPNLTWEALKQFHATHYHPSNAAFVSYGDEPPQKLLQMIEENVLARFDRIEVQVDIPDTKRFEKPVEYRIGYPVSKDEDPTNKAHVQVAWSTVNSSNSFEVVAMRVLEKVLLGNPASPLRKALIESGLGEALDDFSGFSTDYREAIFAAGLKGASEADAKKIEALVLETLEALVKDGVNRELVDAAIHQMEIETREISDRPMPYAIKVIYEIAPAVTHGGDPYSRLRFDEDIARLEQERSSGQFFEELIRRNLLDNPHRALVVVYPDQDLEEARTKREAERVAKAAAKFTDEDKKKIVADAAVLKSLQESKGDVNSLPTLELSDIPMTLEDISHQVEETTGGKAGYFPQPTNGLTYIDIRTDFSDLPDRLIDRLGLFAYAIPKMGAAGLDHIEMARRIDAYTGGVSAAATTRVGIGGQGNLLRRLTLSGKSLVRNNEKFVEILRDQLTSVEFDARRLKELIAENKARYDTLVSFVGTQFALMLASSKLVPSASYDNRVSGLGYYSALRELAGKTEEELAEVVGELNAIREHLFTASGLEICVTSEEGSLPELRTMMEGLVQQLPSASRKGAKDESVPNGVVNEARVIAAPVNYNARAVKAAGFTHPDAPALLVLSTYLADKFLHVELREKAGAYGAGAAFDPEGGTFMFYTSQDPNVAKTYSTFERSVQHVMNDGLSKDDLKEAILASCTKVDPLLSPDTKGRVRFFSDLAGYTLEEKAKFKAGILEVTEEDLKRVASSYLVDGPQALATLGSAEAVKAANDEMGGIFEVSPV